MSASVVFIVAVVTMFLAATGRLADMWEALQGKGPHSSGKK